MSTPDPDDRHRRWRAAEDERFGALHLTAAVEAGFSFLLVMGFQVVHREDSMVRYESSAVFVQVFQSRDSYDLGFDIGLLGAPQDHLTDAEVWAVAGAPPPHPVLPTSEAQMESGMSDLARRLRACGQEILRGDPGPFAAVAAVRDAYTEQFTRNVQE